MNRPIAMLLATAGMAMAADALRVADAAPATARPAPAYTPPPRDAIPDGPFGDVVRRGEAIFLHTRREAGAYVGNELSCQNCHLDAGRLANAAPLWGAYPMYPAFRAKNNHVVTFQERLQGCFVFSMNGRAPPLGSPVLVALESYAYWMSSGVPVGTEVAGRGYPKLSAPARTPDYDRGEVVYGKRCALCHGADGQGRYASNGRLAFPPLWGPQSFKWGAGMANVDLAAGFVKANMPLGLGGSLSDQDAWDVAMFIDSHERPQDPRFLGDVERTARKYHDTPWSNYGKVVNGKKLGLGVRNDESRGGGQRER